ncbi:MAG: tRNA dihydrouridine(20/20a) synthase DusA [Turneriella sp.]|nr:tRNA dihydrouridine(20/20a) synthase DusA [Turneriella sp.]
MSIPWPRVSIAPMMDVTNSRFRYFLRLLNPDVLLYTEMTVARAILHGDRRRILYLTPEERPVVLQLGGNDPQEMAEAARIGAEFGYDGIDINCGCPSDRVGNACFGVMLMRSPERVAEIVDAIKSKVDLPISVKCRLGITGEESEEKLLNFASLVFAAGATKLTVHARTATLGTLSPKQNRSVPPLHYDWVYRLKQYFPKKVIEINGGIRTEEQILNHLAFTDRVMLGRLAQENPVFFADRPLSLAERLEIFLRMADYAERHENPATTAARFFATMLNFFSGFPGARRIRQFLSEEGRRLTPKAACQMLREKFLQPITCAYYPSHG